MFKKLSLKMKMSLSFSAAACLLLLVGGINRWTLTDLSGKKMSHEEVPHEEKVTRAAPKTSSTRAASHSDNVVTLPVRKTAAMKKAAGKDLIRSENYLQFEDV